MTDREYALLRRSIVDLEFVVAGSHGYVDPDAWDVVRGVASELRELQASLEAPGLEAFKRLFGEVVERAALAGSRPAAGEGGV